jgi:hypothetical protein
VLHFNSLIDGYKQGAESYRGWFSGRQSSQWVFDGGLEQVQVHWIIKDTMC